MQIKLPSKWGERKDTEMPRVKRGTIKRKKRTKLLKETKGFRWGRKNRKRQAKGAALHARKHAFIGRKKKKRVFRALWNVKINAAARAHGLSYSRLMGLLKTHGVGLNRRTLAHLAEYEPKEFEKIVGQVTKTRV